MNDHEFDRMIHKRITEEKTELTLSAQENFRDAMDEARIHQARQRNKKKKTIAWIVSLECIAAAALMLFLLPARDLTDQGLLPQQSQQEISATMVPVTQPEKPLAPTVSMEAAAVNGAASLWFDLQNHSDDIWLIECVTQAQGDAAENVRLIWLEPGAECRETLIWTNAGEEISISAQYHGLRVMADMLHWLDGEPLSLAEERYQEQQSLMEAAFAARALILSPGEWENGKGGVMNLLLPESWKQANPGQSTVAYYLDQGMLEDGSKLCGGSRVFQLTMAGDAE